VVIFRRWKVALPLLLLTIGGTAFVALTAEPDYTMTSYVQLIPAKVAPTDDPTSASLRNPWNQLGLNTLGQASIYATQDQRFLESLKAAKHTDNFTLTLTYPNPIITVEVVGTTQVDARETTQLVINRLRESAESLQKGSGVSDADIIATQRLDQGLNLLPSRSKVKRSILAVAAAGLVMTAGGAVGFDALMRRRARRRRELEEAESPAVETPVTGTANGKEVAPPPKGAVVRTEPEEPPGEPMTRKLIIVPPPKSTESPAPTPGTGPSEAVERTAIVVKRSAKVAKHPPAAKSPRPSAAGTYRSANAQSEANGADHETAPPATNGDVEAAPSDVRVVLQPKRIGGENGGKSQ
jgi:hypothetical protein